MSKRAQNTKLPDKVRLFVDEYCVDFNGTQAAIRAGYAKNGAGIRAWRLLRDPRVVELLEKRLDKRRDRNEDLIRAVAEEYATIALSSITDVASWDGQTVTFKPSAEIDEDALRAVAEVSSVPTPTGERSFRVKMHSKTAALEGLANYLGMRKSKFEHTGKDGGPIESETGVSKRGRDAIRQMVGLPVETDEDGDV